MDNIKKELHVWFDRDTNTYSLEFGSLTLECLSLGEVERITIGELVDLEKRVD